FLHGRVDSGILVVFLGELLAAPRRVGLMSFDRQGHERNGRHPPDAAVDHMVDARLVKKPAVLERVDLGGERVANTVETFRMHGDALALRPSLGYRPANVVG